MLARNQDLFRYVTADEISVERSLTKAQVARAKPFKGKGTVSTPRDRVEHVWERTDLRVRFVRSSIGASRLWAPTACSARSQES